MFSCSRCAQWLVAASGLLYLWECYMACAIAPPHVVSELFQVAGLSCLLCNFLTGA